MQSLYFVHSWVPALRTVSSTDLVIINYLLKNEWTWARMLVVKTTWKSRSYPEPTELSRNKMILAYINNEYLMQEEIVLPKMLRKQQVLFQLSSGMI